MMSTENCDTGYALQYSNPAQAYAIYQEAGKKGGCARALYYVGLLKAHDGNEACIEWLQACIETQQPVWSVLAEEVLGEWYFKIAAPSPDNITKAERLFVSAYQRGSIVGGFFLGCWLLSQQKAGGVDLIRQAAARQLKPAQMKLGLMTFSGIEVAQDKEEGVRLYELGVKNPGEAANIFNLGKSRFDEALACFQLGYMYQHTTSPDDNAMKTGWWWITLASDRNQRNAQYTMGKAFLHGLGGLRKDEKEGLRLLQLAADQQQRDAQYVLGERYVASSEKREKKQGIVLLQQAVDQNQADAQFTLAKVYLLNGLKKKGVQLLNLAVAQNHRAAQYLLGRMYLRKNEKEGVRLICSAAAQNYITALEHVKVADLLVVLKQN